MRDVTLQTLQQEPIFAGTGVELTLFANMR